MCVCVCNGSMVAVSLLLMLFLCTGVLYCNMYILLLDSDTDDFTLQVCCLRFVMMMRLRMGDEMKLPPKVVVVVVVVPIG